jgi:ATP phosphoribosyltransferase
MKKEMVLGISSGSLLESTRMLLKKIGIEVEMYGRNFIAEVKGNNIFSKAIIMRPNDLPHAVRMGVVDAAITGLDLCLESGLEKELCVITELIFSKKSRVATRVVVFGRKEDGDDIVDLEETRVSSEYMYLASTVFKKSRIDFSTGSTEIKVTLKDFGYRYGVGVVESGKSLVDNGLKIIKTILTSPVVLIAKQATVELQVLGRILSGALEAECCQLVKFNADLADKNALLKILPAMEAPTISNLSDGGVAIETVVPKSGMTDALLAITRAGGKNILIQDIIITV